ncbi:hypothetical protein CsSME_00042201 [Camellia sinensis var. sinensis]
MLLKIRCNFGQNYGFFRLNLDLDALKGFQTSKQVSKHLFQIIWILYALFKFSSNEGYFIKLFNNEIDVDELVSFGKYGVGIVLVCIRARASPFQSFQDLSYS